MITTSYLIYIVLFETLIFGGCGYAVFIKNRSGWWFLLAVLIAGCAYSPSDWAALYTNERVNTSANSE